jgi:hypothetical protein
MKPFQLYLAIGGEHFAADEFKQATGLANSVVKRIGERGQQIDPMRFRAWTIWESARIAGSNEPGEQIRSLLKENSSAVKLLNEERWVTASRWIAIVGYYADGDGPRGFAFDEDVINAISSIGASLKIDMVIDPAEIRKHAK